MQNEKVDNGNRNSRILKKNRVSEYICLFVVACRKKEKDFVFYFYILM